jgi:hypothetical protein
MAISAFIEVTDRNFTGTDVQINPNIPKGTEFSANNIERSRSGALIAAGATQLVKKAANRMVSKIGDRSGNRQLQNDVTNVTQTIGYFVSIAQGGLAGFSVGAGPAGAIAGAGVAGVMIAFDVASQQQDYNLEIAIETVTRESIRNFSLAINNNNRKGGNS